jgi:hypothetical protein
MITPPAVEDLAELASARVATRAYRLAFVAAEDGVSSTLMLSPLLSGRWTLRRS